MNVRKEVDDYDDDDDHVNHDRFHFLIHHKLSKSDNKFSDK